MVCKSSLKLTSYSDVNSIGLKFYSVRISDGNCTSGCTEIRFTTSINSLPWSCWKSKPLASCVHPFETKTGIITENMWIRTFMFVLRLMHFGLRRPPQADRLNNLFYSPIPRLWYWRCHILQFNHVIEYSYTECKGVGQYMTDQSPPQTLCSLVG